MTRLKTEANDNSEMVYLVIAPFDCVSGVMICCVVYHIRWIKQTLQDST